MLETKKTGAAKNDQKNWANTWNETFLVEKAVKAKGKYWLSLRSKYNILSGGNKTNGRHKCFTDCVIALFTTKIGNRSNANNCPSC